MRPAIIILHRHSNGKPSGQEGKRRDCELPPKVDRYPMQGPFIAGAFLPLRYILNCLFTAARVGKLPQALLGIFVLRRVKN